MYAATSSGKRRRTSSASKDDDTSSVDFEYQPDSKRKRLLKADPDEQCQQLYDIVRNHKKEDGVLLCEPFIRVPKRRQEPAYYEVVSNPMDMIRIQQKIKMDEYEDIEQMSVDIDLMLTNAKAFYKRSSQEYKDACDLWELYVESKLRLFDGDSSTEDGKGKIILKMGKLARRAAAAEARKPMVGDIDGGETSESSTTTDKDRQEDLDKGDMVLFNQLEDMFSAVMTAKDVDDRPLHAVFQLLPSRKKYPSYYEVIDNPIDLKMIAIKIQAVEYTSLADIEKDMLTMCRNACSFNEPGSQIYKDAKMLKKIITSKRHEIEHSRQVYSTPGKTSERIRNRKLRSGVSHSAVTAALQYEEDDDDDEVEQEDENGESEESVEDDEAVQDEEDDDEESYKGNLEDPQWALFDFISSYTSLGGTLLSDPFKRLPSRRYYPDYYKEIKNPISLSQIRARVQRGEYVNLTQVQADMNVMFENAKAYNIPDSSLYRTAVKLQKAVQLKVQELLGPDQEEESSNDDVVSIAKRSTTSTPLPTLTMEGDFEMEDLSRGADDTPNTSTSSAGKTPTSGKKSFAKSKTPTLSAVGTVSNVTTVPIPKTSPFKEDKNLKNLGFKEQLKRRTLILYQTIADYHESDGRSPISLFMEKPSKKLYPDYYRVIVEPIDMMTIKANIDADFYNTTDELMKHFILMFNNCRQYNEEGSPIYEDANKLEKLLQERLRQLGPDPSKPKPKRKKSPVLLIKQKKLLDIVRDHKDKNGRQLSSIFVKLPSKAEYPEYYEIIKSPMDLDRISTKQRTGAYDTLDQLSADLMLMFDNACKFNEPDSQIYKDALVLQQIVLQTKLSLASEDDGLPDVPGAVKEILISIFTSVYNHQDEEGRCFTDTMAELPEHDEMDGQKKRAVSLDLIKSRLDRGYYKRLDCFQRDMFLCFERSRKLSRTDSQLFEDSIELHSYFIRTRNEICKSGEILRSPAFSYSAADLEKSIEATRLEKKDQEAQDLEEDIAAADLLIKKEESTLIQTSQSESFNEQTYCIGDFVYIVPSGSDGSSEGVTSGVASKGSVSSNIANIQKLWTAADGTKWFEGIWFFRPDQTYHIPTRKFLQKEVFRSEVRSTAMLSEIVGKCWVMTVKGKEYFNYAPEGYPDEDVYVCEYRYSSRGRCFTKLKTWAFGSDGVKLIPRPKPLDPIRVASVFRERIEKHKEELLQMEEDMGKAPAEEFLNIELPHNPEKPELRFFEQFSLPCGPIRSGDFVYVRVEDAKKLVARVDSMWADSNGTTFFHGPWFTSLSEISPSSATPGRVFYKQEIFQSSIEDTNPLLSICGKCSVLDLDDYIKWRPTEMSEVDIFVCESLYDEARRQIKKFDGLKKYTFKDNRVHQDEIYCFRRPINVVKVDLDGTVIPEMPKLKVATKFESASPGISVKPDVEMLIEDSLDGSPPSLGSLADTINSIASLPGGTSTPTPIRKFTKGPGKKLVTGYILYSSEVRRSVAERNPTSGFGEISRMVGQDWKKLSREQKQKYEEKAAKMNEEKEAAIANGIDPATIGPGSQKVKDNAAKQEVDLAAATAALKKDPDWIFECCWSSCDWQFEDALDLIEHCVQEPKGHVPSFFKDQNPSEGEFQCNWKNCARVKKGVNPFPNLTRLLKHVRDIHILKANGRIIHPEMRSKRFVASRNPKPRPVAVIKTAEVNPVGSSSGVVGPVGNVALRSSTIMIPASSPNIMHSETDVLFPYAVGGSGTSQMVQHTPQVIVRQAPPQEPLFIAVPPRPQKLLHSEAYIRYIESLHAEKRSISDWEKTLKVSKDTVPAAEPEKLPTHWLANGAGPHGSVTNALWALRNFMMKDALNLHRNLRR